MTPTEKVRKFEATMIELEKHRYFEMIYDDGTWDKITEAIQKTTHDFSDDEVVMGIVKRVVQAINWNCRIIYSLDTTNNTLKVMGYEGDDGSFIKDASFVHPFSKLPGSYPTYNFF